MPLPASEKPAVLPRQPGETGAWTPDDAAAPAPGLFHAALVTPLPDPLVDPLDHALPAGAGTLLVDARTDAALGRAYLQHADLAFTTLKSTTTEVGRFLLWCQARHRTLGQIRIEDLAAYKAFLRDPQPAADWISPTRWPRLDARWRPFAGPLSDASVRQAFRVARALLAFGANTGYLVRNPGSLVHNIKAPRGARVTRYLNPAALACIEAALNALPARTPVMRRARARIRWLFLAYLTTGARLSEIVAASMGSLYFEGDGRWWLDVLGKGNKARRLPVSPTLLAAFRAYRLAHDLPAATSRDDVTPLVLGTRGAQLLRVSDEAAAQAMKALFAAAALLADQAMDADAAAALRAASTHWLRHTMLTMHANNGVALKTLQDTAGHASLATTATYLHKSDQERHDELMASLDQPGVA